MTNINSRSYWDNRFGSGDWEQKLGGLQTKEFAESQVRYFDLPSDFNGTLLDFGCGLGESIPVYRKYYPAAKLIGLDFSEKAIELCIRRYGDSAEFIHGDFLSVPEVDIIVASNIFEHLSDDLKIAAHLKSRCKKLFIIVPYKEQITPGGEHVNSYNEKSFTSLSPARHIIFRSKGWTQNAADLYYHTFFKNILRTLFRIPLKEIRKQLMFIFE
jgi:cyclopropane fatty-acyl-phospholipid synthase-like methyltransferase